MKTCENTVKRRCQWSKFKAGETREKVVRKKEINWKTFENISRPTVKRSQFEEREKRRQILSVRQFRNADTWTVLTMMVMMMMMMTMMMMSIIICE